MMHDIELSGLICMMSDEQMTLNRLEASDNGQNILSETMEMSGQSQVHNTTFHSNENLLTTYSCNHNYYSLT